ncbi:MAG: sodium-translocating pyrophosphatase, partial [Nitrospirae bacterium]
MEQLMYLFPLAGLLALAYAGYRTMWINRQDGGTERMREIGSHIREGAMAFLAREYRVLSVFVVVVAVLLALGNKGDNRLVALSFAIGAICSATAGFFGMRVATAANFRTTNACRTSLVEGLKVAFAGGSVMGMAVVGLGVLGLSVLLLVYTRVFGTSDDVLNAVVLPVISGFSLGASSIALFARVGGGIYTKAADVGADLVGKVEAGIPEDDPRNPA